jgi:hypothetical protein
VVKVRREVAGKWSGRARAEKSERQNFLIIKEVKCVCKRFGSFSAIELAKPKFRPETSALELEFTT